jgi:hypothetical protein
MAALRDSFVKRFTLTVLSSFLMVLIVPLEMSFLGKYCISNVDRYNGTLAQNALLRFTLTRNYSNYAINLSESNPMTAVILVDAGTPAFIVDSLQCVAGKMTRAPENQSWIDQVYPASMIHRAPLVNKLMIHNGAAIAFAGNTKAIKNFARFYKEEDLSGVDTEALADRILAMREVPYLGGNFSEDIFHSAGTSSCLIRNGIPFRSIYTAGIGEFFIKKRLEEFEMAHIGVPWMDGDRSASLISHWGFAARLNSLFFHNANGIPDFLNRQAPVGSKFGGFFQAVFYEPETSSWRRSPQFAHAVIDYDIKTQSFVNVQTIFNERRQGVECVVIYKRNQEGQDVEKVWKLDDPFVSFPKIAFIDQGSAPIRCCSVSFSGMRHWPLDFSVDHQCHVQIINGQVSVTLSDILANFLLEFRRDNL